MNPTLPPPLSEYFRAANAHDADRVAACFAQDAVVNDERQERVGREAIRGWADETGRRYRHNSEVFSVQSGLKTMVKAKVTGDFPGSPIELTYTFTIENGLVSRLEIG